MSYSERFRVKGRERERERESVCVRERERETDRPIQTLYCRQTNLLPSFVYFFVGWYANAASLHMGDVILAQPAGPLSDVMFCFHQE